MLEPPLQDLQPPEREAPRGAPALLEAVRRAQRRQLWIQGALAGAAAALLLALLAGYAAHASLWLSRALFALSPLALAAALGYFGVLRARRAVGDDARTARLIGERIPEVSLDLLAAVELRRQLEGEAPFSPELARAHLEREDARAQRLAAAQVVDPRLTRWPAWGFAGYALLAAIALSLSWHAWRGGAGAALRALEPAGVASAREPITGDVELTYRYPAYTGLPLRTVPGTGGEVSAPAGTEVRLKTRADRDVKRASLRVNGKDLPLQVSGGRELEGGFLVEKSGSYSIAFENARGRELARGPETKITAEQDAVPQVSIRTPGEQLEIDPGQKVTLRYEVSDDYGLTSLELVYRPPGRAEDVRVKLRFDEGRRTRGEYAWDLGGLKLSPGDRIPYRIEARDNDTVTGPKLGQSRAHVLKVYSAAEHRRDAVAKAEQLWERLVKHLGDRLEGPDRADPKDLAKVDGHGRVDQQGLQLVSDLREVARQIASQRDAPADLWGALSNVAGTLHPRVQATSDARRLYLRTRRLDVPEATAGKRLARAAEDEISELEKDVLYLETLIDRQKLQDLKELGKQLAARQRELASLLEDYKKTQDPKLRADILQQIQDLKGQIQQLMQRMAEMAQGIRDEHLNAEALQQMMQKNDVGSAMDEIEKLLREGKVDEALKKLQELQMQMGQMLDGLDQGEEQLGGEQYAELAKKMAKFSSELQETAQQQKRAAEETKQIRDRYREQQRQQMKAKADPLRDFLKKETEALRKSYQQVDPSGMNTNAERPLEEVRSELENLKNALDVDDLDLAAESASRADRAANDVAAYGEQQKRMDQMFERPREMQQQSAKLAGELQKDAKRVGEVDRKLQQLFPSPGEMLSEADRQKLKQLSGEQRQLERKAQGLRQQMDEMAQEAPIFGQDASEQMQKISEKMGEAGGKLEGRDPARGYGDQRAALDQLDRFKEQMKQKGKGGKGGIPMPMFAGNPMGEGSGGLSQEKVEIPDEDQFQAPREFRKDLLDAMKEGTPDKYREQVKRYYEELVK